MSFPSAMDTYLAAILCNMDTKPMGRRASKPVPRNPCRPSPSDFIGDGVRPGGEPFFLPLSWNTYMTVSTETVGAVPSMMAVLVMALDALAIRMDPTLLSPYFSLMWPVSATRHGVPPGRRIHGCPRGVCATSGRLAGFITVFRTLSRARRLTRIRMIVVIWAARALRAMPSALALLRPTEPLTWAQAASGVGRGCFGSLS